MQGDPTLRESKPILQASAQRRLHEQQAFAPFHTAEVPKISALAPSTLSTPNRKDIRGIKSGIEPKMGIVNPLLGNNEKLAYHPTSHRSMP
jgi:hypothetical protein